MPSLLGLNLRKNSLKKIVLFFLFSSHASVFGFLLWMNGIARTPFMQRLSDRLRTWAEAQANGFNGKVHGVNGWRRVAPGHQANNPDFRGVTIVISCDRDPGEGWGVDFAVFLCWLVWEGLMASRLAGFLSGWGEGEHKIMNVIRNHPEHTHCLCSNDAASWMAKRFDLWLCSPSCQYALLVMGKFFQASAVFQRLSFVWMWGFGIFGSGLQIRTRVSLAHKAQLREEASPRFGGTGANKVQLTNINPNWGFPYVL